MPDPKLMRSHYRNLSPEYRFFNAALNRGLDGLRRERLAAEVADALTIKIQSTKTGENNIENKNNEEEKIKILDIACGSGILSFELAKAFEWRKKNCHITGVDFADELITLAKEELTSLNKTNDLSYSTLQFQAGDALNLEFDNDLFDAVTIAYGMRFFENRNDFYKGVLKVLKPGGRFFIIDTTLSGIRKLFYRVLYPLVPWIMKMSKQNPEPYRQIAVAALTFPNAHELKKEMKKEGFEEVSVNILFGGTVAMVKGRKSFDS